MTRYQWQNFLLLRGNRADKGQANSNHLVITLRETFPTLAKGLKALASNFAWFQCHTTRIYFCSHYGEQYEYYEFKSTAFTTKLRLQRNQFTPFPPQLWNQTCPSPWRKHQIQCHGLEICTASYKGKQTFSSWGCNTPKLIWIVKNDFNLGHWLSRWPSEQCNET